MDQDLQEQFRPFLEESLTKIDHALAQQQWAEVRAAVHPLTGTGTTFGFPEITRVCAEIENSIDENRFDEVANLVAELKKM